MAHDQALGTFDVVAGCGVAEGLEVEAVVLVPQARPGVELIHDRVGLGLSKALAQQVAEEVVVAIPVTLAVERNDEQVRALEMLQRLLARRGGVQGHGIAQGSAQPIEDRRAEQELADSRRLTPKDLLDEIVEHEAVAPRERPDECGGILVSPQGDGRELKAGDPALRGRLEGVDVPGRQTEIHDLVQECGALVGGEPQVGSPDLAELGTGTPPGERQGRIFAGGDGHVHP